MKSYEIITKNGITMLDVSCIRETGIAEGYFTTRRGGISVGTTSEMNCNLYKKLDLEAGQENFRLFCKAIGIQPERVITNRLTASTNLVRRVSASDLEGYDIYDEPAAPRADGIITNDSSIALFLYSADCATVMLLDQTHRAIGVLHAGWAGSLNGIIPNTVNAMVDEFGTVPAELIAVICPSISGCCFEVGVEVSEKFIEAGYSAYVLEGFDKPHIDLFGVNSEVLADSGINVDNIHKIELCTRCHEELFHSYRRGPVSEGGAHLNGMNGMFLKLL